MVFFSASKSCLFWTPPQFECIFGAQTNHKYPRDKTHRYPTDPRTYPSTNMLCELCRYKRRYESDTINILALHRHPKQSHIQKHSGHFTLKSQSSHQNKYWMGYRNNGQSENTQQMMYGHGHSFDPSLFDNKQFIWNRSQKTRG